MADRIDELLNRNLQEVFGEGDAARRRAAIEELYTDDCVLYAPPAFSAGRRVWTSSPVICVRRTLSSRTRLTVGRRRCITPAAWHGGRGRGEKPDYTGLDVIIVRDDKIAALYVFLDSPNH